MYKHTCYFDLKAPLKARVVHIDTGVVPPLVSSVDQVREASILHRHLNVFAAGHRLTVPVQPGKGGEVEEVGRGGLADEVGSSHGTYRHVSLSAVHKLGINCSSTRNKDGITKLTT